MSAQPNAQCNDADTYDMLVVGYGPVGMVVASLMGQAGHSVGVFERYGGLYNRPRAATFDHETTRTLQALGCADEVLASAQRWNIYQWINGVGELLIEQRFSPESVSGWAEAYLMYQPGLEDALDRVARGTPGVAVHQGWRAVDVANGSDRIDLTVQRTGGAEQRHVRGRYLLACDGGNSFVRQALGIGLDDLGFHERWLVCDFAVKRDLTHLPQALQVCDPEQPSVLIQLGPNHRRFSFMILPDETEADAVRPEAIWQRVHRWVNPKDVELIRATTYIFQSLIAERWRAANVFLLGDAAHQMPPFLGQGMVSGIRDARNLAWKLDLVLRGAASQDVLATYQPEREPHVRTITDKAIELGRIQTLRDRAAAARRDVALLARRRTQQAPDRFEFPGLTTGVIGHGLPQAGELFPQGRVRSQGMEGLFDDVVGPGFILLLTRPELVCALSDEQRAFWQAVGGLTVILGDQVNDVDGTYERWFLQHGCVAAVIRPDCYAFGGVRSADELTKALDDLRRALNGQLVTGHSKTWEDVTQQV